MSQDFQNNLVAKIPRGPESLALHSFPCQPASCALLLLVLPSFSVTLNVGVSELVEQKKGGFQPKGPMGTAPPWGTKSSGNWRMSCAANPGTLRSSEQVPRHSAWGCKKTVCCQPCIPILGLCADLPNLGILKQASEFPIFSFFAIYFFLLG